MKRFMLFCFIAAIVCAPFSCRHHTGNQMKAMNDVSVIQMALTSFYLAHSTFPDERTWEEDIGLYVDNGHIPRDPWGNKYVYRKHIDGESPYRIYSMGPDGKTESGGSDPDDICTCKKGGVSDVEGPIDAYDTASLIIAIIALGFSCYKIIYIAFLKGKKYKHERFYNSLSILNNSSTAIIVLLIILLIFYLTIIRYTP